MVTSQASQGEGGTLRHWALLLSLGKRALGIRQAQLFFLLTSYGYLPPQKTNPSPYVDMWHPGAAAHTGIPQGLSSGRSSTRREHLWVLEEKRGAAAGPERWQQQPGWFVPSRCS